jgi:ATP-binding cassette subfamily C (CFTR/MRP) protein 1
MAEPSNEKEYRTHVADQMAESNDTHNDEPVAEVYENGKDLNADNNLVKEYGTNSHSNTSPRAESSSEDSGLELAKTESRVPTVYKRSSWTRWLTFRSRTIPPVPKTREVSHEAAAGILSVYSFQWMQPIMHVGYQRTLEVEDLWLVNPKRKADLLAEKLKVNFKKRVDSGHERPLLMGLYDTLRFEFLLGAVCQFVSAIVQVLNPFILRYLITFAAQAWYAANDGTPAPDIGHGIGLVIGITILQTIQSGCTNQFLYRGMMNGGQARAALISLIFDKSMTISGRARAGDVDPDADMKLPAGITAGSEEEAKWMKMKLKQKEKKEKAEKKGKKKSAKGPPQPEDGGWSNGRIVNLMSTDTYRVDQASGMFHMIWTAPIRIFSFEALLDELLLTLFARTCHHPHPTAHQHHIQCFVRLRSDLPHFSTARSVHQEPVRAKEVYQ